MKQELRAAGFQIYKSEASQLQLALRVRDNLILDSGVWVTFDPESPRSGGAEYGVRCVFRAQRSDQGHLSEPEGFALARTLAKTLEPAGYTESCTRVVTVDNPSQPGAILDTWWEVVVEKAPLCWAELLEELRAALQVRKIA